MSLQPDVADEPRSVQRRTALWLAGTLAGLAIWAGLYSQLIPLFAMGGLGATGRGNTAASARQSPSSSTKRAKVLLLLTLVVFAMGIVRSFFSPERTRAMLAGKREGIGNVLAACLGIVTPFCSCSAVPAFIGFVVAGVPLGVTFSFLIAAPMVNEVALGLLFGLVGWKVALIYLVFGLAIAIVAGWVIGLAASGALASGLGARCPRRNRRNSRHPGSISWIASKRASKPCATSWAGCGRGCWLESARAH